VRNKKQAKYEIINYSEFVQQRNKLIYELDGWINSTETSLKFAKELRELLERKVGVKIT
jgi:hypothetical protein